MSDIVAACREIANRANPDMLIILESTTYPVTTEEVVLPMLNQWGLHVGKDLFVCFSPQGIDPGNALDTRRAISRKALEGSLLHAPRCADCAILKRSRSFLR